MSEEAAFLEAIRREPTDETVRLVYADWLEDRDDARAEFLRVESQLRQTCSGEPSDPVALARWLQLRDRVPGGWINALDRRVNALPLPLELVKLIAEGQWGSTSETDTRASPWGRVYSYSLVAMGSETVQVCSRLRWLGASDRAHPPGDIEPDLVVLIGDEGIGSDAPFALDYRASFGQPRVLFYRWVLAGAAPAGNRWVEIAPHFSAFRQQLDAPPMNENG